MKHMIKIKPWGWMLFLAAAGSASASVEGLSEQVTVPLSKAFIPAHGFDDNDNVQAVIEGYLPNACFTVADTQFSLNEKDFEIRIEQRALKNTTGPCADPESLPADARQPIYFKKDLSFGQLAAGSYHLTYETREGTTQRAFLVEVAPTDSVDTLRYAIVKNAFVDEVISSKQPTFEMRIQGYLNSSCAQLDEPKVEKIDDVYVVLMDVVTEGDMCMPTNQPFYRIIEVPTPAAGRYLLHVRSLAGQSKNRLFSVVAE